MTTTHDFQLEYFPYWPIKVSFYTYSFIFMHDGMLRTLLWSQTCLHTLADRTITQIIFAAQFTSRLFPYLGKTPGHHIQCLSQVFICFWLSVDQFHSLQDNPVWTAMISSPRTLASGVGLSVTLGAPWYLPTIGSVPYHFYNPVRTLLSHQSKGLSDLEKFRSDIAFFLVLTEECTVGDRVYGLSTMWVNPYQARVTTVKEAVKQLAPLIPTGSDWLYALVWLNADACHVPLPRERHLRILMEGGTSSAACRWISQLDVHQLLSLGSQVVYPEGLNGCEIPVITYPPKSLAKGMTMLRGEPIYLLVDILQSASKGQESKAPSSSSHSIPILTTSPIRAPPPKAEGWVSMTMEVRELLSQAVLDTSGHALGGSSPKRLDPVVLVMPLLPKPEDFPYLGGYILPSRCPRWRQLGPPHPREGPCHLLPYK